VADTTGRTASTLNELIQSCRDTEHGFQSAALLVDDLNLRRLFQSYAQQRAGFVAELQLEMRRLAGDPVEGSHASAALHRAWVDIKAGVSGRDEGTIISECERSEDGAVKQYQEALESGLPNDLQMVIARQFHEVKQAHDHVRSLERVHSRHG
jgi:uncharacterized protein (TIGR02284 family)